MDTNLYGCLECRQFFSFTAGGPPDKFMPPITRRIVPIEEATALVLAGTHPKSYVCNECRDKLAEIRIRRLLRTPTSVRVAQ